MRYERIIRKVVSTPWLIIRSSHAAIVTLIESKLGHSIIDVEAEVTPVAARPKVDFFKQPVEQMEIDKNRIATIPVKGIIGSGLGNFEKSCGAVDTGDIAEELDQAVAAKVRGIILNFDSPGGTVSGTIELADKIAAIQEAGEIPIYAFVNGMCCSAAYWLASGTSGIFATKSSDIGSIGVYMPWVDRTKAYDMMGLKVDLIKAGKLKGTGYPGTALSEDQRAHLQSEVDDIYNMFTAHIEKYRGEVPSDLMQGQSFMADKIKNTPLIDGIKGSIDDVKKMIMDETAKG